jgi:hypothetical protein
MTYSKHRYPVAFVIVLLAVICLQSSGAIQVQRPDGGDQRGFPCAHCCHAKVFLQLDRRYELRPVFDLPSFTCSRAELPVRPPRRANVYIPGPAAGVLRRAWYRGPPEV